VVCAGFGGGRLNRYPVAEETQSIFTGAVPEFINPPWRVPRDRRRPFDARLSG
jgi:hypothetical protein